MRKVLFIFVILLVAIGLGFLIHLDSGYLLFSYHGWTLETSIWIGLLGLIVSFLVLQMMMHFIYRTTHIGMRIKSWGATRSQKKGRKQTINGLCELAEGNWQKAESLLVKSAEIGSHPFINYLAAARAAQAQEAFERRDDYLKKAHESKEASEMAVGLTQAQLQMDAKQWEQAIATLQHLNRINPSHSYVLHLLYKVYLRMNDWASLRAILASLKRMKVLAKSEFLQLEEKIYLHLLSQENLTCDAAQAMWHEFPRALQLNPQLVVAYVNRIVPQQRAEAIKTIIAVLSKNWNAPLILLFGQIAAQSDEVAYASSVAEKWLQHHPGDPELLLCLGKLAIAQKIWGKAKFYLEASVAILDRQDVYQELGCVMQALGEQENALKYYKKGLEVC